MIGEQVERAAAGFGVRADHRAIVALVEKRTGLLAGPWRREVRDVVLHYFDNLGNLAERQDNLLREPFMPSHAGLVAQQKDVGPADFVDRGPPLRERRT